MLTDLPSLRRVFAAVLLSAACIAIPGCGDSDPNHTSDDDGAGAFIGASAYPASIADRFTRSCVANARVSSEGALDRAEAEEICARALECVEDRLTIAEFREADRKVLTGEANPNLRVIASCGEDAAEQYAGEE